MKQIKLFCLKEVDEKINIEKIEMILIENKDIKYKIDIDNINSVVQMLNKNKNDLIKDLQILKDNEIIELKNEDECKKISGTEFLKYFKNFNPKIKIDLNKGFFVWENEWIFYCWNGVRINLNNVKKLLPRLGNNTLNN